MGVANAGVFDYGAAQSLLRAELELNKKNYKIIIFSIFIEDDFHRDKFLIKSGLPRPALIKKNNVVTWAEPPSSNTVGTRFNPKSKNYFLINLYENSFLFASLIDSLHIKIDYFGNSMDLISSKALPYEEVIDWTLKRYSLSFENSKKILLLQYRTKFNDVNTLNIRSKILKDSKNYNFLLIDTLDLFNDYHEREIWNGHHTILGNEIICSHIFSNITNK